MKKLIVSIAAIAALITGLEARTWTSADGSKTFEGTLRSVDGAKGTVTVIMGNGSGLTFSKDKLSKEDIAYIEEWAASQPAPGSAAAGAADTSSVIGEKLSKAKLHKVDGNRMKRAELTKAPEFYVLYFSASW
ncbi:MAG: hypothetical protein AAF585_07950 [Verrucomicrobiota bacterium]